MKWATPKRGVWMASNGPIKRTILRELELMVLHTNFFGCLNNNIILFSGLDESGNEKRPAQAVLDGHFAAGSLESGGGNGAAGVAGTTNVAVLLTAFHL
ncbi:hypothetical protein IFM89_003046 [Coptis chinensis]|uniref:Uncharacterized protein n=1 Tax=Coptis chinensis TaxID=261450 RepID=A0A835IWC1_9MAGN|nr:hypothetical protein IFM89_003046 [Coptis chinensis]